MARFGANWLGWDAEGGCCVSHPTLTLPRPLEEVTRTPRRYGFHATLKPPFRLSAEVSAANLDQALAKLAFHEPPATSPRLAVSTRLGFLALLPIGPAPEVAASAAACTHDLDRFRAPPTAAELAQRRENRLTAGQEASLIRWGYPYVLEEFRFHMTLTGRLRPGEADALRKAATTLADPHLGAILNLDEVCLFGDPGGGRGFRLLRRYPLTGARMN